MEVFSTITSPTFSELVIVIGPRQSSHVHRDVSMFEMLRAMNEVRPFKLVFSLEVSDLARPGARLDLARGLEFVTAKGLLNFLDSPPTIRIAPPEHPFLA